MKRIGRYEILEGPYPCCKSKSTSTGWPSTGKLPSSRCVKKRRRAVSSRQKAVGSRQKEVGSKQKADGVVRSPAAAGPWSVVEHNLTAMRLVATNNGPRTTDHGQRTMQINRRPVATHATISWFGESVREGTRASNLSDFGLCATDVREPRQVRKEATVTSLSVCRRSTRSLTQPILDFRFWIRA